MKRHTCEFVLASQLIPARVDNFGWREEFWCAISDNAPFSWGDNDRTMVTASRVADHCQNRLDDSPRAKRLLKKLWDLGETYIDLEN